MALTDRLSAFPVRSGDHRRDMDRMASFAPKCSGPAWPSSRPCSRTLFASSGRDRTPTLGFQIPPLRRTRSREVSSTDVAAGFGPVLPRTVLVPPSWSLTTSTGCSLGAIAGLLHPAPDPGVHRVSARAVACASGCPSAHARSRASSPMLALQRVSRMCSRGGVTAISLPPRRCPTCLPHPTSRPCSTHASVAPTTRCHAAVPDALLGFPVSGVPPQPTLAGRHGLVPCLRGPERRAPSRRASLGRRPSTVSSHPRGCVPP